MKKTSICVTVDFATLQIAKEKVDNISRYINECLAGLSGRTAEDRTREELEKELETIKGQMQELSIRQNMAQLAIKDIEATKAQKAKELANMEKFKRWNCGACHNLNFMENIRCTRCNLPTRNDHKTVEVMLEEVSE